MPSRIMARGGVVEVERLGLHQFDAEEGGRDALQPVLAAGQVAPLVGDEVDHLREREGDHGEVDAGPAHRQVADRDGEQHGEDRAAEDRDRERHARGGWRSARSRTPRCPRTRRARRTAARCSRAAGRPRSRTGAQRSDVHRHRRVDEPGQRRARRPARRPAAPSATDGRGLRRRATARLASTVAVGIQLVGHAAASSRPNSPAGPDQDDHGHQDEDRGSGRTPARSAWP